MIEALISSKTRIKLLFKFFLNENATAWLRGLESEMGESSNAIRLELNKFEQAGLIKAVIEGNKKIFSANTKHPLFKEIHNILLKHIGIDQIINTIIERLGNVEKVFLTGGFARGQDGPIIDLIIIGDVDRTYLANLSSRTEQMIKRKIRYVVFGADEYDKLIKNNGETEPLLLWNLSK